MKKFALFFTSLSVLALASCGAKGSTTSTASADEKTTKVITVCASTSPHAEVLENAVKPYLAKEGYSLEVTILDWTMQNDAVANGDYDANYFQHQPYLSTYEGTTKLAFSCTVHYEPLGIYKGNGNKDSLSDGSTFEICNDTSNAIRAFQLLENKGVISKAPVTSSGEDFDLTVGNWNASQDGWSDGKVSVSLVAEELLVASKSDYDFALLPCNTAYTGNVDSSLRVAKEDDPSQVQTKANGLAVRVDDYLDNTEYKEKIDALTEALLSSAVSDYFDTTYLGAMTCDSTTQIDLRNKIAK